MNTSLSTSEIINSIFTCIKYVCENVAAKKTRKFYFLRRQLLTLALWLLNFINFHVINAHTQAEFGRILRCIIYFELCGCLFERANNSCERDRKNYECLHILYRIYSNAKQCQFNKHDSTVTLYEICCQPFCVHITRHCFVLCVQSNGIREFINHSDLFVRVLPALSKVFQLKTTTESLRSCPQSLRLNV